MKPQSERNQLALFPCSQESLIYVPMEAVLFRCEGQFMAWKKRGRSRLTLSTWFRCGARGHFLTAPNGRKAGRAGAWFSCPSCGYNADRDYAAALVIGLLSSGGGSLERLAAYTAAEFPRSRSRRKRGAARIASAASRFGTITVKNLPAAAGDNG